MSLKETPLSSWHRDHGGRMVAFAGWTMPVQYAKGVMDEHRAVRASAGLFDVSHMARFDVLGEGRLGFLDALVTNDVKRLTPGRALYTALCDEDGGTIDDLVIYCREDRFLVVANAANHDAVWDWFVSHAEGDVTLRDESRAVAQIALQGPKTQPIIEQVLPGDFDDLAYYRFVETTYEGQTLIASRNGYTGEDGFELYVPESIAASLWQAFMDAGGDDISPAGLGARDTLRLEVAFPLYGNELSREISPVEAGLGWVVKTKNRTFIGHDALRKQKKEGTTRRLAGLVYDDRLIGRQGAEVSIDGERVGTVTSGTFGPSVERGIALALIDTARNEVGTKVTVDVRGREVGATIRSLPFYTEGSHR